jgi:hypothetical protein
MVPHHFEVVHDAPKVVRCERAFGNVLHTVRAMVVG